MDHQLNLARKEQGALETEDNRLVPLEISSRDSASSAISQTIWLEAVQNHQATVVTNQDAPSQPPVTNMSHVVNSSNSYIPVRVNGKKTFALIATGVIVSACSASSESKYNQYNFLSILTIVMNSKWYRN